MIKDFGKKYPRCHCKTFFGMKEGRCIKCHGTFKNWDIHYDKTPMSKEEKIKAIELYFKEHPEAIEMWNEVEEYRKTHNGKLPELF